jgi:release factor glutamine methyltransferase
MTIKELKENYHKILSEFFPSEEINSFIHLLSEKYLSYTRLDLAINASEVLSEENEKKFTIALERLSRQEPIQYIIGHTHFFGNDFLVDAYTLIPRPETEELVQWVIDDHGKTSGQSLKLLDLGTGTGCIAISLAKAIPASEVSAIDVSSEALSIAKKNAEQLEAKIQFIQADLLSNPVLNDRYDVIVSNPPYVRNLEKKWMKPNVLDHEPSLALFVSDEDPLLFYRHIARLANAYLASSGILYLEINQYLSDDLRALLKQEGFEAIEIRNDIFGNPRMAKVMRS